MLMVRALANRIALADAPVGSTRHERDRSGLHAMRPTPILPPPVLPRKKRRRRSWLLSLLGFGFASGVVMFVAAAGRGRLLRVEGLARSARLREPRQVRAAGDDAHPRARRQPDGRVRARAAHLRADQRRAEAGHRRLPVGRGQALLRARRSRLHRHRARRPQQSRRTSATKRAGGRLDHHPAGGQELPAVERAERWSASSRRRSSPSASSAPTRRTRSSSSISTRSISAWAPTAWPPPRSTTSTRS